jgi:hypothetical protein
MWSEQRWGHPDPVYYENLFEWIGVTWVLQAISNAGRTAQLKTNERSLASSGCARQMHIPRHPEAGAHAKCGVMQPRTDEVESGKSTQSHSSQGAAEIANASCVHSSGDRWL